MTLLFGILLGAIQIGSQTWRTVQVVKGNVGFVFLANLILSVGFWFSIRFVVERDVPGYVGFSLGAGAVTTWLAWHEKRRREKLLAISKEAE